MVIKMELFTGCSGQMFFNLFGTKIEVFSLSYLYQSKERGGLEGWGGERHSPLRRQEDFFTLSRGIHAIFRRLKQNNKQDSKTINNIFQLSRKKFYEDRCGLQNKIWESDTY